MHKREQQEVLMRTGAGTPMGRLFRRFWIPALLSRELPGPDCPPVRVMLLGEPWLAFRDTQGRVGLVDPFCAHRGAPLFFGRNEECGLRCVYHGWKYDVEGHCVDIPSEPANSEVKRQVRLRSCPVREAGDLIWAYLGPPQHLPQLPQFEWMQVPPSHRYVHKRLQQSNYLYNLEGEVDSAHISFLHSTLGPPTERPSEDYDVISGRVPPQALMDPAPVFSVRDTDYGMALAARRNAGEQDYYWRITQFLMPFYTLIPAPPGSHISFTGAVPRDDESMWGFTVTWHPDRPLNAGERAEIESWTGIYAEVDPATFVPVRNKANDYLIDRDAQRRQSYTGIRGVREQDLAVQEGMMGFDRSKEFLWSTDTGIVALRRYLLQALSDLENGKSPAAALDGSLYRVRPAILTAKRALALEEAARDLLRAAAS